MELYKKYRPKNFKRILGQPEAVKMLSEMVIKKRVPHAILFSGPSGCGKTTLARILKKQLNCSNSDYQEINCADFRGIDMVRDIRSRMNLAPIAGECRIYLIDEAHELTSNAQNALLKSLEDTPKHVYFMLATTHPQKLIPTIRTRCTDIAVKGLTRPHMLELIKNISESEELNFSEEVIDRLVECSDGSARKCLVLLDQIQELNEEEQLRAILKSDSKQQAIAIARCLIGFGKKPTWKEMAKILEDVEEEAESIRWMVLSYASKIMLKGGKLVPRAYLVVDAFSHNFYDTKRAGLIAACWEIVGAD